MARGDAVAFAAVVEFFECVLPSRFKQTIARRLAGQIDRDERLVDERREQRERVGRCNIVARTDRCDALERKGDREDTQPPEQGLFLRVEQVVAPVDDTAHRPVTRRCEAVATRKYREPVFDPARQFRDRHRPRARRGEFDRERETVEPAAHLGDQRRVVAIGAEVRVGCAGPLDEERDRSSQRKRRDPIDVLAADVERLATGRDDVDARRVVLNRRDRFGRFGDQVFAVVDDQQELFVANVRDEGFPQRAATQFLHAERRRDGGVDAGGIGDRSQPDNPHPVRPAVNEFVPDMGRGACLPGAADPDDRHERRDRHQIGDLGDHLVACEKRRHFAREIVLGRDGRRRRPAGSVSRRFQGEAAFLADAEGAR